jgi:hypothetical protein
LLFVHSHLSAEYLIYRLKHRNTNQNFLFNSKLYHQSSNCTCMSYSSSMYQLAWEMFFISGCCGTAVTFGKWWLHNFAWICHFSHETIHSYWFRITTFMKIENCFFKYVLYVYLELFCSCVSLYLFNLFWLQIHLHEGAVVVERHMLNNMYVVK